MFRSVIISFLFILYMLSVSNGNTEDLWKLTSNTWQECYTKNDELTDCLQSKLVSVIDRATRADSIPLWNSVSFIRTANTNRADFGRAISESDLAEARKQGRLQDLLWDRLARFLSSHTVKIDLPNVSAEDLKIGVEEGRGKMKKMMGMMLMGGAMKAMTLIPLILGKLFILAGKALIISKVALVLSLLITVKKLLAAKQDDQEGWQTSSGHGGGWDRRSLEPHTLAYSAYKQ